MVRFFLPPHGFNFQIYTYKTTLPGDENNFGLWEFVFSVSYPISNMHTWRSDEMFSAESVTLISSDVSALAS
jgi:hypothetical protein